MIVKIFGILDLIAGISFWLSIMFKIIPQGFLILLAFYLIAKGTAFLISKDVASILDIIAGIIIFLSFSLQLPTMIVTIVTVYLLQKGVFSLL